MESRKRSRAAGRQTNGGLHSGAGSEEDDRDDYHGVSRSSRRQPKVDLSKLEMLSLRKYRRTYNLKGDYESSKEELVPTVTRHFAAQVVDEDDILLNFAFSLKKQYMARRGLLPTPKLHKGKSNAKVKK